MSSLEVVCKEGLVVIREFLDGHIHATHTMTPEKARTLATWLVDAATAADRQMPREPV